MTILGKNPFRNVLEQYYLDTKVVKSVFKEASKQKMRMGNLMEPLIKKGVEDHLGIKLLVDKKRYSHDEHLDFTVEFDAVHMASKTIYEFKNTEMDEKHLLETYYGQVQFAMYIIGWDKAVIAYLRNGWELGYIEIARDEDFISKTIPLLRYYADCVKDKTEPDADYIMDLASEINFFNKDKSGLAGVGEALYITDDELEMLYAWADIKIDLKKVEKEHDTFKEYFGDKFGKFTDPSISYTNSEYVRKGSFDTKLFMKDFPEIDFRPYMKADNVYKRQSLRMKKGFVDSRIGNIENKVTKDIV